MSASGPNTYQPETCELTMHARLTLFSSAGTALQLYKLKRMLARSLGGRRWRVEAGAIPSGSSRWRTRTPSTATSASSLSSLPSSSAKWGTRCARHATTSSAAPSSATNAAPPCWPAATAGATAWSASSIDSLRAACPNAPYGCAAMPPYHAHQEHLRAFSHAPCHCPAGEACGFVASTAGLLDRIAGAHRWPCTTGVRDGKRFTARLHHGFNFVVVLADAGDDQQQQQQRLFLLNVTRERVGRAISVICIHPHAQPVSPRCDLVFRHSPNNYEKARFKVACTDLSHGLLSPDVCFHFLVPTSLVGEDDRDCLEVKATIFIT